MATSTIFYQGKLHTEARHNQSGTLINTDAPVDNNGKGEAFSPTDLCATSLACCMLTVMGIAAESKNIPFNKVEVQLQKVMASDPRRISRIEITMKIFDEGLSEKDKAILENTARTCPVAKSLHPDIEQDITFSYENAD
jgi:putative redox protein